MQINRFRKTGIVPINKHIFTADLFANLMDRLSSDRKKINEKITEKYRK